MVFHILPVVDIAYIKSPYDPRLSFFDVTLAWLWLDWYWASGQDNSNED